MRRLAWCTLLMAAGGCCPHPWDKYPMSLKPDRACRTGSPSGYDVYLWKCVQQQKVVIYQFSGEMSCQQPQKQTAACGELTAIEKELGAAVDESCRPVPDAMRWP
jgi:hypothetical protein